MTDPLLARALPALAALAVAWEIWLLVAHERRRGWAMTRPVVLARLFVLAVLVYLAFFLGRPVSMAGGLTVVAIGARAITDALAIRARRHGPPIPGPNAE